MFNASFNMYTKLKEFVTNEISVPKEVLPQPTGRDRPHAPQAPGERPLFTRMIAEFWDHHNNVFECQPNSIKTINS
jgi:hypothetical protein